MPLEQGEIDQVCQRIFGEAPTAVRRPGGPRRKTVVLRVRDRTVVLTRRASPSRANLEASCLTALSDTGLVPRLLAVDGAYVVQHFVGGARLSQHLHDQPEKMASRLIETAVDSLLTVQSVGAGRLPAADLPLIGARDGWIDDLLAVPRRLAQRDASQDTLADTKALSVLLTPTKASFVKWDARPANLLVRANGAVCWIDWEHCGRRAPTDDLAWLLADEWCPDLPDVEHRALQRYADVQGLSVDETTARFHAMATLHSFVRLSLIMRHKGDGDWWPTEHSLRWDLVGVNRACMLRVIGRARRWCASQPILAPYLPLLDQLEIRHATGD